MTPLSIWPISSIVLGPSDNAIAISLNRIGTIIKINYSTDYFYFSKMRFLIQITQTIGLIVEFKLEAVNAVKLLPFFSVAYSVLPGPIKVFDAFHFWSNQFWNFYNFFLL